MKTYVWKKHKVIKDLNDEEKQDYFVFTERKK